MSFEATAWAYRQDLPSAAKFVLVALADFADEAGSCYPGQATLAAMTGQGERSVRRNLKWLEDNRVIVRERRTGPGGHRTSDRYLLAITSGQSGRLGKSLPARLANPTGQPDQPYRPNRTPLPATVAREPSVNRQGEPSEEPSATAVAVAADPDFQDLSKDELEPFIEFHKIRRWRKWLAAATEGGYYQDSVEDFRRSRNRPLATSDRKLITNLSVAAELEQEELEREQQRLTPAPHETQLLGA